jgi:para-aminobenzoate synthetase/4-amino-4-deoxychorismate lyase
LIDRATNSAEYGVGGGIVWDSTSTEEYAEALLKAHVLIEFPPQFSLLETLLWVPNEGYFLHDKHIARLLDTADYFDFNISKEILETYLSESSSRFISPQRVRLLLDKNGKLTVEANPVQLLEAHSHLNACLAKKPVDSSDVFLFHKTTHRNIYESARKDFPKCDDVLLYNKHNELTEFTLGNLVVKMNRKLYTPPISCGLLAGTFRAHLLETGHIKERVIRVNELKNCTNIFLVNSVRKWQRVKFARIEDV